MSTLPRFLVTVEVPVQVKLTVEAAEPLAALNQALAEFTRRRQTIRLRQTGPAWVSRVDALSRSEDLA
jgi:1,2-phenylacetyl-CoA epoxidase PaaB subunit